MNQDLLNPSYETEKYTHKLKRLVPTPNSYFLDIKCVGCYGITQTFSHSKSVVQCEVLFFIYLTYLI